MEDWSVHHLYEKASSELGIKEATAIRSYAKKLRTAGLPVIFSLRHLSQIVGVDYNFLRDTVDRRRDSSNYKMFSIPKRNGGKRFIHAVSSDLSKVHSFLNSEILQKKKPHPSSFAFHEDGGIAKCAAKHCGARWLFQYDIKDFFYSVSEIDVYKIFLDLGYTTILSFELSRICTTTRLPEEFKKLLRISLRKNDTLPYEKRKGHIGVLPQGASTSPALSNLSAYDLDLQLNSLADSMGFEYTRYADDLTFSAVGIPNSLSRGDIHRKILHAIRKAGFVENEAKRRIAGPGSRKIVLGLLVDGESPRLSRDMFDRIDSRLYGCEKFGLDLASVFYKFDSPFGFYNHISGYISFAKDVDHARWLNFDERLKRIPPP